MNRPARSLANYIQTSSRKDLADVPKNIKNSLGYFCSPVAKPIRTQLLYDASCESSLSES
jgi:hypothetical protein